MNKVDAFTIILCHHNVYSLCVTKNKQQNNPFLFSAFSDILADQGSPLLQDPDILSFSSYPSMQYPSMEPNMSSTPYYSSQNYYPPYTGDEWYSHTGIYELRKGPLEGSYLADMEEASPAVPVGCKRTRHMTQAGKVKGEELCVVCGDKASGYHYNALTCEGCKGEWTLRNETKPVFN